MNKHRDGPTTLVEIMAAPDSETDFGGFPELGDAFWRHAQHMDPSRTKRVTLMLKQSVLDAFMAQGGGYEIRMNEVLEAHVQLLKAER